MKKKILGASIGNCVHVSGVVHFLKIAEDEGYDTLFLGPAISIDKLFAAIEQYKPDIVSVGFRLTAANVKPLLDAICEKKECLEYEPVWTFGGTKPVADIAASYGIFAFISDGFDDICDAIRFLRGNQEEKVKEQKGKSIIERIQQIHPYPVLRHHFGLPSVAETIGGIERIAEEKVLDVISLGPDQNAQQFFFKPNEMDHKFDGAGGVPIRKKDDLEKLKKASQRGNYPLMRCYSGTEDVMKYAGLLHESIDNAWAAVPLLWYNEIDGRGSRTIEASISEAQQVIQWHANRGIPVEINEPHHWGLRDAHDVIPVAMAYISAYNAKKLGVKDYIAQYMFNNPSGESLTMDFARVQAMIEMVESLEDDGFKTYRQTRAGLSLFHADRDIAKGQLATSTFMQMVVNPHIMHVVAFCEANHAAEAEDVIESCKIVKGVIRETLGQEFSIYNDERIRSRKDELVAEAKVLLEFICNEFREYEDPLANPVVLALCVKRGFLDAVHIVKNHKFKGTLSTKFVDGKCVAYDPFTGKTVCEKERLENQRNV